MAIYYLNVKTFSRRSGKAGSRATSGAAYRAGERIRDERTGAVYDHSRRADVMHKEIILPSALVATGTDLGWARDRSLLWNAAEHAEARKDARVAREFTLALPHELQHAQRVRLAQAFAHDLADRYGNAVDLVIHAPRGDPRNFHAHLLTTTREITADGFGSKTALELSGTERHRRGLARFVDEMHMIRERWSTLTNQALREAHVAARVSHLSLKAQGMDRPPKLHLPIAALYMERRGERSFIAERLRERHRRRVEQLAAQATREASGDAASASATGAWQRIERLRAQAIERWRSHRERAEVRDQGAGHDVAEPLAVAQPQPVGAAQDLRELGAGEGDDRELGL